jgi:hypothetical protein
MAKRPVCGKRTIADASRGFGVPEYCQELQRDTVREVGAVRKAVLEEARCRGA